MPTQTGPDHAIDPDDALVPLFLQTADPPVLRQIGTGVFVEFWSQPFLLTVAHVIDEQQHGELIVPLAGGMDRIEGYIAHIDLLPEDSRKNDPIDIAYCRLTDVCATRLCRHFRPLPQSRLQLVPNTLELGVCSVYENGGSENGGSGLAP